MYHTKYVETAINTFDPIKLFITCILDIYSVLSHFSGLCSAQCFYESAELSMCVNSDDVVHRLFV